MTSQCSHRNEYLKHPMGYLLAEDLPDVTDYLKRQNKSSYSDLN